MHRGTENIDLSAFQNLDLGVHSPNGMLLDPDEFVVDPLEGEKDDVAIINPDSLGSDTDLPDAAPMANDCMFSLPVEVLRCMIADLGIDATMKDIILPPLLEQPPILEDQVNTWHIQNWRNLQRKEHGPVFEAGGFPW